MAREARLVAGILVGGGVLSVVISAVALVAGMWLGKPASALYQDLRSMEAHADDVVRGTSASLPLEMGGGFRFVRIERIATGVRAEIEREEPIEDGTLFDAVADETLGGWARNLCGLKPMRRMYEKGGVAELAMSAGAGAARRERVVRADGSQCTVR